MRTRSLTRGSNISKTSASVLPGFHFIVFECLETPVKHEARVFEMASQSAPDCKQEKKRKQKNKRKKKSHSVAFC